MIDLHHLLFINQLNLNRFHMQGFSSRAGALARFNPIEPTLALHMRSIDDVIMLGKITRQLNFNSLYG